MRRGVAVLGGLVLAVAGAGAPVLAQGFVSDSYTFLKAVHDRDGNKAQELLDKHPSANLVLSRDTDGEGVLHIVTRRRDLTWLQFMIGRGAPVDQRDQQGNTALADAAQLGWTEGAQALLDGGATVDLPNDHGETPLILATEVRNAPTVRVLLDHGADPNLTDSASGMSAIGYAKRDGRMPAVLKMLQDAPPVPKKKAVAGPSING